MSTQNALKQILKISIFLSVWVVLNSLYFEYCISREIPSLLIMIASPIMLAINMFAIIQTIRWLQRILNL